jgi:hypothetical protein
VVIEIDDLMKRIRDYDPRKPIKPDFGAGKQMGFPKGADLVERCIFSATSRGPTSAVSGQRCTATTACRRR